MRVKWRVKALWSQKPQARAMSAMGSEVPARRCMACSMRARRTSRWGVVPKILRMRAVSCVGESPLARARASALTGSPAWAWR